MYAVVDPATGEQIKAYPTATDAEIRAAVAGNAVAHAAWAARSIADRAAIVKRIGELHTERAQELGAIIERAQAGAVAHAGRHPAHAANLVDRAALRNRLARELREAVSREEYERAARLRDRLSEVGGESMTETMTDTTTDTTTGTTTASKTTADAARAALPAEEDGCSPSGGAPS
jgi:acyl-CoA reductase-like NAD-dependent aldehyde dehydrogenase